MRQCLRIAWQVVAASLAAFVALGAPSVALATGARSHVPGKPATTVRAADRAAAVRPGKHRQPKAGPTWYTAPLAKPAPLPSTPTLAPAATAPAAPTTGPAPTVVVVPSAPAAPAAVAGSSLSTALATDPKLSPAVVATALQATAARQPRVHVIAYGATADGALQAAGAADVQALDLIQGASGTIDATALPTLTGDPRVDYVVVDAPVNATDAAAPAAPSVDLSALAVLVDGMTPQLRSAYDGTGVGIAVIDSGVSKLADFGKRVTQVALPGQTGSLDDTYGHGTFVAGVAAGRSADGMHVGVAPGASVYAINVNRDGSVYTSDVISGLAWVAANARKNNIRVVNLSLAENAPSSYKTSALDQAVEAVWKLGVVVVASSGNSGPNSMYYAPGNDPFALTVGASDPGDTLATADDVLASFSSYGTTADGFAKPDVVAPGRHVVGPEPAGAQLDLMAPDVNHVAPGYLRMNGTSFAAPQVAGAIALLAQAHPDWTPDELKGAIVATARPLAGSTAGALDLGALLALAQRPRPANAGTVWSIGPAKQALNDVVRLNTAAAEDAAAYQRAAVRLEGDRRYADAASAWRKAANSWTKLNQVLNAAAALDRSAVDATATASWDVAAGAWQDAGDALATFGWADWAAVSYEFAGRAWAQAARPSDAIASWEHAAGLWETYGAAPKANQAAAYEAESFAWWYAAGLLGSAGRDATTDQCRAVKAYAAFGKAGGTAAATSSGWTSSGWTLSSGWTSSGWTVSSTWNSSGWTSSGWTSSGWTSSGWTSSGWTASATWNSAAGWTTGDTQSGVPGELAATGWS